MSWKQTGRWKRRAAVVPTLVWTEPTVAGNGPPCCIAPATATPVGHPFQITRPARSCSSGNSFAASAWSRSVPWIVAVRSVSYTHLTLPTILRV